MCKQNDSLKSVGKPSAKLRAGDEFPDLSPIKIREKNTFLFPRQLGSRHNPDICPQDKNLTQIYAYLCKMAPTRSVHRVCCITLMLGLSSTDLCAFLTLHPGIHRFVNVETFYTNASLIPVTVSSYMVIK